MLLLALYASPAHAQTSAAPLSIGQTFTIASKVLGETRRINVYLPAGYAESTTQQVPVLYMPDGGMAEDFLHVAGLVQVSVGNGTMRPYLLVGIENTERRRDMTGPTTNEKDKKIAPRVGGSAAFRRFIRTELMPEIKRRYRTTEERAVVGESLAGLFVVETLLLEPDLFGTYLAFDPSLWWNNRQLVQQAPKFLTTYKGAPKTLFIATSNEPEIVTDAGEFVKALQAAGNPAIQWRYEPMPQETHGTIYHPAALRAFRQVFKPVPAAK
ncbi:alpha/beta hydrolase [Hymenobacter pini]|uniref:alpha/beta hydrolase n=1 Tax=Hymenobacter pini TaxID=2880879 RepID=UPI001CF13B3C|nr:alpha/beta hydrolase-fold protein [Hymenobacter pini]MCA8829923.1 alpha/beta hydrolase [Hymenobacter pini]